MSSKPVVKPLHKGGNPKGNTQNLIPFKKGHKPPAGAGYPKGMPNRKTILKYMLFQREINDIDIWGKIPPAMRGAKPKTLYEMMVLSMAIRAISGDVAAFSALNHAIGIDVTLEGEVDVMHIYKPEKVEIEAFNELGATQRERVRNIVEGEFKNAELESTTGAADAGPTSTG